MPLASIALSVLGIAVPALLTWARDMSAQARRIRTLDELSKLVSFWGNFIKVSEEVTSIRNQLNNCQQNNLKLLAENSIQDLMRAGETAKNLYRPKNTLAQQAKFPLTFRQFQKYRSQLPLYRRALLLYKAPNPRAASMKLNLYYNLCFLPILWVGTWLHYRITKKPMQWFPASKLGGLLESYPVLITLPSLAVIASAAFALIISMYISLRRQVTECENVPRYYLMHDDEEENDLSASF